MAHKTEIRKPIPDLHTRFGLRLIEGGSPEEPRRPDDERRRRSVQNPVENAHAAQPWLGSGSLLFYPTFVKFDMEASAADRQAGRATTTPDRALRTLLGALAASLRAHLARRRRRRVERELLDLSDHLLRDIGVSRDQLTAGRLPLDDHE